MVGMDMGQRKYAVVHYLSMGKFVDEEILFSQQRDPFCSQQCMVTHTNTLALNSCSS